MERLICPAEALTVHRRINETARPYPSQSSIKELFERCAEDFGSRTAIVHGTEVLTYRDLNRLANGMACRLRQRGVAPGDCVALCIDRSAELIVSLLAIVKCGASYLPLNASWPGDLLGRILDAFGCRLVLLGQGGSPATRLPAALSLPEPHPTAEPSRPEPHPTAELSLTERRPAADLLTVDLAHLVPVDVNPGADVGAEAIAYVNFTSGTTGDPKGVPIQHRGVARLVFDAVYAPLDENSVLLHLSPVTFDAATFEIWGALLRGGTCVLYPSAHLRVSTLRQVVRHTGVSVLFVTTALFNAIVDEAPDTLDTVGTILTGGERYSHRHFSKALSRYGPGRLVHVYGPTECTTFATYHPVSHVPAEPGMLPIGKPIQNTRLYLVQQNHLCGPGDVGEILIAGPGLSPGYLGAPGAGRPAFAEYDIGGVAERVYRTGDYGYLLGSGELIFEGRRDDQVKVSGFRVEMAELARVIGDHPRVRQSYVTVAEAAAGDKIIVVFVVGYAPDPTVPDPTASDPAPPDLTVPDPTASDPAPPDLTVPDPTASDPAPPDLTVPHLTVPHLTVPEVLEHVQARVPRYMVPAIVQICDHLPLTASGKVDRRALLAGCRVRLREPAEGRTQPE